jgi:hypothetical protein
VYFVSDARDGVNPTNEIYVARKPAGASAWTAPAAASVNSPTLHDHLPFAANVDGEITLVWTRSAAATPWESADADVYFAVSPDGLAWSGATAVAHDAGDVVHVFPSLTRAFDGDWSLVWLSTRSGGTRAFELPRAAFGAYPAAAVALDLPEGYSHRVAPTSTEGVYFAAWVQGPDGAQDVWYRFFAK